MEIRLQSPLNWPIGFGRTPKQERKPSSFRRRYTPAGGNWARNERLSLAQAEDRVRAELRAFTRAGQIWRITEAVLTCDVPTTQRNTFHSGAREPDDSGAAVYFELDGKPVVLCCDRWNRVADNFAAIAATLDAMRGLERWGVTESERVFTGFAALPAPGEATSRTCWEVLGLDLFDRNTAETINSAFRSKAKECHPDAGGTSEAMAELITAREQALAQL